MEQAARQSCPSVVPFCRIACFVCREGVRGLQSKQRLDLDVIIDVETRKEMHAEITSLARTAPPTARAWQMAQVTLATWSAVLGNLGLARHVGSILSEHPFAVADGRVKLASVVTLHSFVDAEDNIAAAATATQVSPRDDLDAKATLFLSWLRFLRTFADARTNLKDLHSATLAIRKLVSTATTATTASHVVEDGQEEIVDQVESSLDIVTDLCTALGRTINRLPSTSSSIGSAAKLLMEATIAAGGDEDRDSGIEL